MKKAHSIQAMLRFTAAVTVAIAVSHIENAFAAPPAIAPYHRGSLPASTTACSSEPLAPPAWKADTLYLYGQRVTYDGRVYQMVGTDAPTGGRSGSTGPTGSGATIPDGSLVWSYTGSSTPGRVFFVCDCGPGADSRCQAGDDDRSQTQARNPATPWRSLAKARREFGGMAAGDTIALCRGGVFVLADDEPWGNLRCRANHNCILRDYSPPWASGSPAGLPIIESSRPRAMPFMSGGAGYRVLNLHLRGIGKAMWGFGLSSNLSDLTLCNDTIEGFGVGLQDDCGGHQPTTARTVILGSRFLNNRGMGILAGGDGTVISDNFFDGNGNEPTYDHSIYLSNPAASPVHMRVIGNEIRRNTMRDGLCRSVSIVAHGQFEDLLVEDNLIAHPGLAGGSCWGIGLNPGGYPNNPEFFRRAVVRRNRIFGTGSAGIAADMCTDCLIENNLVVVDGNGSSGVEAIKAPTQVYTAHGSDHSRNITIRNNTIYFTSGATSGSFRGISSINDGSGHVVSNNAVAWYGTSPDFACLNLQASYTAVSNNGCYGRSIGYSRATRTITGDPRFSNPGNGPSYDFTPANGSPLVGAADPANTSPIDLSGKNRDGQPDIGAYER